jgi:superfamily I DNA/RNA helicase
VFKVGTFKRAKGLEFKLVLLPGPHEGPVEPWGGESTARTGSAPSGSAAS